MIRKYDKKPRTMCQKNRQSTRTKAKRQWVCIFNLCLHMEGLSDWTHHHTETNQEGCKDLWVCSGLWTIMTWNLNAFGCWFRSRIGVMAWSGLRFGYLPNETWQPPPPLRKVVRHNPFQARHFVSLPWENRLNY